MADQEQVPNQEPTEAERAKFEEDVLKAAQDAMNLEKNLNENAGATTADSDKPAEAAEKAAGREVGPFIRIGNPIERKFRVRQLDIPEFEEYRQRNVFFGVDRVDGIGKGGKERQEANETDRQGNEPMKLFFHRLLNLLYGKSSSKASFLLFEEESRTRTFINNNGTAMNGITTSSST